MTTTPSTVNAANRIKRYEMALESQAASNPVGLTNTILRWSREIMAETNSTDAVRTDPAIRLATYQLAYLCGVSDSFDYADLTKQCNEALARAKAQAVLTLPVIDMAVAA